jgi:hypothetical protein
MLVFDLSISSETDFTTQLHHRLECEFYMSRPRPSGSLSGHDVKLQIRCDLIGYLKLLFCD